MPVFQVIQGERRSVPDAICKDTASAEVVERVRITPAPRLTLVERPAGEPTGRDPGSLSGRSPWRADRASPSAAAMPAVEILPGERVPGCRRSEGLPAETASPTYAWIGILVCMLTAVGSAAMACWLLF